MNYTQRSHLTLLPWVCVWLSWICEGFQRTNSSYKHTTNSYYSSFRLCSFTFFLVTVSNFFFTLYNICFCCSRFYRGFITLLILDVFYAYKTLKSFPGRGGILSPKNVSMCEQWMPKNTLSAEFSTHFFISNSVFALSLELLTDFGKMRLKVANVVAWFYRLWWNIW